MTSNDQWLFENSANLYYDGYGIKKNTAIKVMASILVISPTNTPYASGIFNFGTFFSSGSRPVVVISINPISSVRNRFDMVFRGIGMPSPDYRGFAVSLAASEQSAATDIIADPVYVNFIAMGW